MGGAECVGLWLRSDGLRGARLVVGQRALEKRGEVEDVLCDSVASTTANWPYENFDI